MSEQKNAETLGKILCAILIIIFIIIIAYLISYVFRIGDSYQPIITTGVTRPIDYGFHDLTDAEKKEFNSRFNEEGFLVATINAIDNNFSLKNVNLLETEVSKFKFIYTYLNYQENTEPLTIDVVNNYSQKYFDTQLDADNLIVYAKSDIYQYDIEHQELNYCLKASKQKSQTLLINMISKDETNCDINIVNYNEEAILNQIAIAYEIIDDNFIYKSFIILK